MRRSHYQIVWLITQGKTTTEVVELTGYSSNWIRLLSRRYKEEDYNKRLHSSLGYLPSVEFAADYAVKVRS